MKQLRIHQHRWFIRLTTAVLLVSLLAAPAQASQWMHQDVSQTPIASGTVHETILRFGPSGWQHINVIRMDLHDPYVDLELLHSSSGLSTKEPLTTMMQQAANPVAGINADFFFLRNPDSPLGIMIRDGVIVSSPVSSESFRSFAITDTGRFLLTDWANHMYVSTEGGNLFSVKAYNKITWKYAHTSILDQNWGSLSPGAAPDYPDLVEVVVVDDQVKEIRTGQPPVAIPPNGYILLASHADGRALAAGITPGESITFYPQMVPQIHDIKLAVGGGTILVQDGQVATFTEPVTGNHPRTAVGVNQQGTQLIMATIDGRHPIYTGVDGTGMANLMIELGCYHAIRMDGGGSSTMAVRSPADTAPQVVNVPSDGTQRGIINSLAVSSQAPAGPLDGLLFTSDQKNVFVNQVLSLEVKGHDTYYQPYPLDPASVQYRLLQGSGRIEQNRLIATEPGILVVEAAAGNAVATRQVRVLPEAVSIRIQADRHWVNTGGTVNISVQGLDPEGFAAPLPGHVQLSDEQRLGTFQNGVFHAGNLPGTTRIRAVYGETQAFMSLSVGHRSTPLDVPLADHQPSFLGYPSEVTGQVTRVAGGHTDSYAVRLDYDLTGSTATTAAYVVFGSQGIPVPSNSQSLSLHAHAENPVPHRIRGQLRDGSGQTHVIDFATHIDWTGWKQLTASLPPGLVSPARLERLYVVETDPHAKTRGTLQFDGMAVLSAFPASADQQDAATQVPDPYRTLPSSVDAQWLVHSGSGDAAVTDRLKTILESGYAGVYLTQGGGLAAEGGLPASFWPPSSGHATIRQGDHMVIALNNSGDGLRRTQYAQWPWLTDLLQGAVPSQVIVLLPQPITGPGGFSDWLEAQLLMDQLAQLAARDTQVLVFHGSDRLQTSLADGVRYIGLGSDPQQTATIYDSQGRLYYNLTRLDSAGVQPAASTPSAKEKASFQVGQRFYMAQGERIEMDTSPYLKNGRLMVPVAHLARALGLPPESVEWDGASRSVLVRTHEKKTILMTIDNTQLWVNNEPMDMDAAAEITDSRSFVPISRFSLAMGIEFQWIPETQTVTVH